MPVLPMNFYRDQATPVPLKLDVFVRIEEVKRITRELERVAQLTTRNKNAWMAENEAVFKQFVDDFTQSISMELPIDIADQELTKMLIEYTTHLQKMLRVIQAMSPAKVTT